MLIRVAHVLSHVNSKYAGVPIATRKIGRLQKHYGVDVSFWTTGDEDDRNTLENDGIPGHVFRREFPRGWRFAPELKKTLSASMQSIDIFHIHEVWQYPQYISLRIAVRGGMPFVWSPRASLEPWRMKYKRLKKYLYFAAFCRSFLEHATCMHAVSAGEAEGLRVLGYRGPIAVIPNGVYPDEFASLPDPNEANHIWPSLIDKRVVLFLSRLSPEKGLDQLLPAWKRLVSLNSYQEAMLVLAGPDDRGYSQTVRAEITRLGLHKNVLLTGMVRGQEKMAIISRADLYVLPSYSEGFSNSLLENLAAGKPALITDGCHFPEAAEAGAALCVHTKTDELYEGLMMLLAENPDKLKAMGDRGRELVLKNYTWDISVRKFITLYSLIMNGSSIPVYPEPITTTLGDYDSFHMYS